MVLPASAEATRYSVSRERRKSAMRNSSSASRGVSACDDVGREHEGEDLGAGGRDGVAGALVEVVELTKRPGRELRRGLVTGEDLDRLAVFFGQPDL